MAPKASPSAPRREAGDRGGLGGGPRQQHENDNDDGFDDAYESEASEDSDDDDEDVSSSVFRRRRKLRRPPAQDQEAGGGSHTPYHLIEILINSGSDNLPGVSPTYYCSDAIRRVKYEHDVLRRTFRLSVRRHEIFRAGFFSFSLADANLVTNATRNVRLGE